MLHILRQRATAYSLPTGHGKTACFLVPFLLMRPYHLVIIVSPLLALIKDMSLKFKNSLCFINLSDFPVDDVFLQNLQEKLNESPVFIICTPERLWGSGPSILLRNDIIQSPVGMVFDEAHTIVSWGFTFRDACTRLGPDCVKSSKIVFASATLPAEYLNLIEQLVDGRKVPLIKQILFVSNREIIYFNTMTDPVHGPFGLTNKTKVLKRLVGFLTFECKEGHTVVFFPTIKEVTEYSALLETKGICNVPFTGPMGEGEKAGQLRKWLSGQARVMVATSAASLGIDNGECRSVIVVGLPNSLLDFVQKIGRAGRNNRPSKAIFLHEGVRNIYSVMKTASKVKCGGDLLSSNEGVLGFGALFQNRYCINEIITAVLDHRRPRIVGCNNCPICKNVAVVTPLFGETQIMNALRILNYLTTLRKASLLEVCRIVCGRPSKFTEEHSLVGIEGIWGAFKKSEMDKALVEVGLLFYEQKFRIKYSIVGRTLVSGEFSIADP
ncbi:ATP-dependent DNA helicase RecQ-like [Bemisia tabaci]|uniref:ATP-dependent DNA helicase RecQ-like n=1 Tax=Bemisia tabaci TaxID=7038 RepID=UPI003B27D998